MTGYIGVDYGLGQSNVDKKTGIRYGVISQHTVGQAWYDDAEADYGKPTCPKCGNEVKDVNSATTQSEHGVVVDFDPPEDYEQYGHGCADYQCDACRITLDSQDVFGDEPIGWNYVSDGYTLTDCLDSDIFVVASPYYTFAQFCSPCVPGAGNLDNAMEDGIKTYCLGHEWFEDEKAPYPVFRVDTGERVEPESA